VTPQWLLNAMTQSCVIYARAEVGTDEYGNAVYESQIVGSSRCLLQPVSQAEVQLGRAGVGTFTLFLPAELEAVLSPFSAFEVDSVLYEADGPPADYRQLFNAGVHHIEVNVGKSTA
jgi:hypothetical protein